MCEDLCQRFKCRAQWALKSHIVKTVPRYCDVDWVCWVRVPAIRMATGRGICNWWVWHVIQLVRKFNVTRVISRLHWFIGFQHLIFELSLLWAASLSSQLFCELPFSSSLSLELHFVRFFCLFVCLFVCSFVRSFVRSFVCLFVCLWPLPFPLFLVFVVLVSYCSCSCSCGCCSFCGCWAFAASFQRPKA